tara:strand:- start:3617 stop:4681 length:1065 start_codon:yes stop_codon:yes gene_type:complete
MKFEIITFHFSFNHGALLQSYALKKFLNKNLKVNFNPYQPYGLVLREIKSALKSSNSINLLFGLKRVFKILFWRFNNKHFIFPIKINSGDNRVQIFGSDEIWNIKNPIFGYDNFFLGNSGTAKKIAYAASFGSTLLKDIDKKKRDEIKYFLRKFEKISVRDLNSQKIIKKLLGKKPPIVLDPVFLIQDKVYLNMLNYNVNNYEEIYKEKFAIIYGKIKLRHIKSFKKYCDNNKIKIVSIVYNNEWCETNLPSINPSEFIRLIKYSSYVITSMFHGVQFSVKFKKQFFFVEDNYRKNKLEYFISYLNLKKRNIKYFREGNRINYQKIHIKLRNWIKYSKNFMNFSIKKYNKIELF